MEHKSHVSNQIVTFLLLILAISIWGSAYITSKIASSQSDIFVFLMMRFGVSCVGLTVVDALRPKKHLSPEQRARYHVTKKDLPMVSFVGIVGYTISLGFQTYGTKYAGAGVSSLINAMNPVVICILAVVILHEHINIHKLLCLAIAVIGAFCIVGFGEIAHPIGILFSFLAVFFWAYVSVLIRIMTHKYDPVTLTRWELYFAELATIPLVLFMMITHPGVERAFLNPQVWLCALYSGGVSTIVGHTLWNVCLSRCEASTCSLFYPMQPLTAMILGVLLLDEKLSAGTVIGGILIILGVIYSSVSSILVEKHHHASHT